MRAADKVGIPAQDARLHVAGADHVKGNQEDFFVGGPLVVAVDDRGEQWDAAGQRVTGEDQVEHGHEVALAAAEAAVQVGCLAGVVGQGATDEAHRVLETLH